MGSRYDAHPFEPEEEDPLVRGQMPGQSNFSGGAFDTTDLKQSEEAATQGIVLCLA